MRSFHANQFDYSETRSVQDESLHEFTLGGDVRAMRRGSSSSHTKPTNFVKWRPKTEQRSKKKDLTDNYSKSDCIMIHSDFGFHQDAKCAQMGSKVNENY